MLKRSVVLALRARPDKLGAGSRRVWVGFLVSSHPTPVRTAATPRSHDHCHPYGGVPHPIQLTREVIPWRAY